MFFLSVLDAVVFLLPADVVNRAGRVYIGFFELPKRGREEKSASNQVLMSFCACPMVCLRGYAFYILLAHVYTDSAP